jgi:hypothetical protein
MTGETLLECMDIFRHCPAVDVAWQILRRTMTETPFHPKEALWLAEWLDGLHNETALTTSQSDIANYRRQLAAERASGIEGTTLRWLCCINLRGTRVDSTYPTCP